MNDDFYEEWKHTYYKASTSIQNREKKLEEAAELIERVSTIEYEWCFYEEWKHTYYKASTSIQNREKKLEEAAELIERVSKIECEWWFLWRMEAHLL